MNKMENKIRTIKRSNGKKYSIRENRDRIFLPSEWILFYDCLKEKQKPTFNVLINTGARIMECQNIKLENINFKEKHIILDKVKRRTNFSDGKKRKVLISKMFSKYLKKLFSEKKFKILSTPAANIAMKKALIKSGIKDWKMFSVQSVRKTIESWLVSLDVGQLKILKQFGHGEITALNHYIKIINENRDQKNLIRSIIGNLYFGDGRIDKLNDRIENLEVQMKKLIKNQNVI